LNFDKISHRVIENTENYQTQSTDSHGGTVDTGNDRNSLPVLLDSLYPQAFISEIIRNQYAIPRPPVCHII